MGLFRPSRKKSEDFIDFLDNTPDPLARGRGRVMLNRQTGTIRPSMWIVVHDSLIEPATRFIRGFGPSALDHSSTVENDPREPMTWDTIDPVAGPEIWGQVAPSSMPHIDTTVEGARI